MKNEKIISDADLGEISLKFSALGEIMRLRILRLLMGGEAAVGDIAARLGATQTNMSRHLKKLSDARIVSARKEGLFTYYSICDRRLKKLCSIVCERDDLNAQTKEKHVHGRHK